MTARQNVSTRLATCDVPWSYKAMQLVEDRHHVCRPICVMVDRHRVRLADIESGPVRYLDVSSGSCDPRPVSYISTIPCFAGRGSRHAPALSWIQLWSLCSVASLLANMPSSRYVLFSRNVYVFRGTVKVDKPCQSSTCHLVFFASRWSGPYTEVLETAFPSACTMQGPTMAGPAGQLSWPPLQTPRTDEDRILAFV